MSEPEPWRTSSSGQPVPPELRPRRDASLRDLVDVIAVGDSRVVRKLTISMLSVERYAGLSSNCVRSSNASLHATRSILASRNGLHGKG
jgi:hypothetical protein